MGRSNPYDVPATGIPSLDQTMIELTISAAALVEQGPADAALKRISRLFEGYCGHVEAVLRHTSCEWLMERRRGHEAIAVSIEELMIPGRAESEAAHHSRRVMDLLCGALAEDAAMVRRCVERDRSLASREFLPQA